VEYGLRSSRSEMVREQIFLDFVSVVVQFFCLLGEYLRGLLREVCNRGKLLGTVSRQQLRHPGVLSYVEAIYLPKLLGDRPFRLDADISAAIVCIYVQTAPRDCSADRRYVEVRTSYTRSTGRKTWLNYPSSTW
jgi:hypothetical protein